jgi:Zn-dependent protease with chaperone function
VLFDGHDALGQPVEVVVRFDLCDIRLADGTLAASWPLRSLIRTDIDAPADRATFRRDKGAERLTITDKVLLAQLRVAGVDLGSDQSSRRWPRRWVLPGVLLGGFAIGIAAVILLIDQLPALLTPFVPRAVERAWSNGIQAIASGSSHVCDGSLGKVALSGLMKRLSVAAGLPVVPEVVVIDAAMVNAFTLPDGRIILMRGLIDSAADPDELAGVLAHELGHALHHDPTRETLRRVEVNSIANGLGFGANFAGTMTELSYGRDAEFAADASALRTLQSAGLRADGLGRFLATLPDNGFETDPFTALSDHPATAVRVARLHVSATGATALDAADWGSVKSICIKPGGG